MSKSDLDRLDIDVLADVLLLAVHTDEYKNVSLENFYNKFKDFIRSGNFKLMRDHNDGLPVAFTGWTFVNDEVLDAVLKDKKNLTKEDMDSGENLLFIELFSSDDYYWEFFDYLTEYFNEEYKGEVEIDTSKIYTGCGLKIDFANKEARIKRV